MFALVNLRSPLRPSSARAALTATTRYNSTRLYSSTMHDNDPEVLEKEKNRILSHNLKDKTSAPHDNAPGWNERLASASEAAIKADKSPGTPTEMQSKTVEFMRARRSEEGDNGSASTTAYYARDEVSGPLSGAHGKEEVTLEREEVVSKKVVGADDILKELKEHPLRTPSEEFVKADRGET